MKNKALVFTAYNRPDYLKETLDAWSKVDGIEKIDIYFNVEPSDKIDEIKKNITNFGDKVLSNVYARYNTELKGCSRNTWFSFDSLFVKYDFVILAEDDILPSADILTYFNFLENKYRDDENVAVISASNPNGGVDTEVVYKGLGFVGLIWGTWSKYWNQYFKNNWDFDYSSGGIHDSGWDWHLNLRVMPSNNLYSVYPNVSRSQHIGVNGIHCSEEIFEQTKSSSFTGNNQWKELVEVN